MENENWKVIVGFTNYEVSDLGQVRSHITRRKNVLRKFSFKRRQGGYAQVRLKRDDNGKQKTVYVHRLVAEAFIPRVEGKPDVNHRDGVTANNAAVNLEWCTHRENILDAIRRRGEHWRKDIAIPKLEKPVRVVDPVIGKNRVFKSLADAVRWLSGENLKAGGIPLEYRLVAGNICHAKDKDKMAYGYRWESLSKRKFRETIK